MKKKGKTDLPTTSVVVSGTQKSHQCSHINLNNCISSAILKSTWVCHYN